MRIFACEMCGLRDQAYLMAQKAILAEKDVTLCLLKDYIHGACSMDLPVVGIGAFRAGTDKIIAEMDLLFN